MDLLRTLKQITAPLASEKRKNYSNLSVKGTYTAYALPKILQALAYEKNDLIRAHLKKLQELLLDYQQQPQKKAYEAINLQMAIIRQVLLQPVNLDQCRTMLQKPLQFLKGVGPKRVRSYEKLGMQTVGDLLNYFPREYLDRSRIIPISSAVNGERQSFQGKIVSLTEHKKNRFSILKVILWDSSGALSLVFFNQSYLKKIFEKHLNEKIIVSGKVSWQYHQWQMDNPEYEWLEDDSSDTIHTARIVPVYRLTEGLYPKTFRSVVFHALEEYQTALYETIPGVFLEELSLPLRRDAYWSIHFPQSMEQQEKARQRFAFEEFLLGQFSLLCQKENMKKEPANAFTLVIADQKEFESFLPYSLSESQQKVMKEITNDLTQTLPMNRLIHGDVGSGKTTVAAAALYYSFVNHFQSAFMAPTEILARQCYANFNLLFADKSVCIALLISDIREKERKMILKELASGEIDILVGTHAVIQRDVTFHSLGLVVVDEQHRFGVRQRLELRKKGNVPHLLVMSATPIPRTLALTRYGDLDISLIDQMPLGKKSIRSKILDSSQLPKLYPWVKEKLKEGGKMFVICPLVEDSEKMDLSSSVGRYEELEKQFSEFSVLLLHGRMNAKEKEEIMNKFSSEEGHVLVSTTVVEVGIDIPEANIMVIEDADRFGLAQLHQLRGRIGRKSQKAYCFLAIKNKENMQRLRVLEESDSGFVVAQKDLEQRGPGELWGERQSGYYLHSMIQLEKDGPLLEKAKIFAVEIVQEHPDERKLLENEIQYRKKEILQQQFIQGD